MEFGPILRSLFQNRTRTWLIVIEVALTLAVVVNCLALIQDQKGKIERPTGIDEENIFVVSSVPFSAQFEDDDYTRASYDEDLRALNSMPGVVAASAFLQLPLSGGGSATGLKTPGSEEDSKRMPYFVVSPRALETLGVELVAGRDFNEADYPEPDAEDPEDGIFRTNIIITQGAAERFYPGEDALGKQLTSNDGNSVDTIVGIVRLMHNSWPLSPSAEVTMLRPRHPVSSRGNSYLVRTEPLAFDDTYNGVEDKLAAVDDGRILRTSTLAEVKGDYYRGLASMNQLLGWVSILLVIVTSLGIVGLTSFSVTQRTRQIGTRRALGATRLAILRLFLLENWIMTGIGLAIGLVLTYGLNFALASFGGVPRVSFSLVLLAVAGLWLVGLLAALAPALRGTMVQPVVATRSI